MTNGSGRLPVPVLTGIALHDDTVMQGFAWNPAYRSWVFAQVTQGGRAGKTWAQHKAAGDLTLTKVSAGGVVNGYMYLQGFGHGISIALEPDPATGGTWVWTECVSATDPNGDGFGTRIARFKWADSATVSAANVTTYAPNPDSHHDTPSLSLDDALACEKYISGQDGVTRIAAYQPSDFLAHNYPAISRAPVPQLPGTSQGWAVLPGGQQYAALSGDAYSDSNPPPGNTVLTTFDVTGTVISSDAITTATGLDYREPEGLTVASGVLCCGFASGPSGARLANIYADQALPV